MVDYQEESVPWMIMEGRLQGDLCRTTECELVPEMI